MLNCNNISVIVSFASIKNQYYITHKINDTIKAINTKYFKVFYKKKSKTVALNFLSFIYALLCIHLKLLQVNFLQA